MKPEKTPEKQAGSHSMLALGLCVGLLLGTALDGFCK